MTPAPASTPTPSQDCILITGSSGRIGSAFIDRYHRQFTEFAFDREGPPHPPSTSEHIISCDVGSEESVREALAETRRLGGGRIASVLHLAAYYNFSGEKSDLYDKVTVQGTGRLLRGLQDFDVEQFVFTSTMLVHAPGRPGEPIKESDPLEPSWDYPKSKVATEELMRRERGYIPIVSLRVAGVYDDDCHSIPLGNQIKRIHGRSLLSRVFPGDLSHGQSFLHMDDLVEALYLCVQKRKELPPESVMLLGEPDVMSFEELQQEMARLIHGEKWWTVPIPKPFAKLGAWMQEQIPGVGDPFIKPWMIDRADDHYELDISRARELIGWEPRHTLRETLPKMVAGLNKDPEAWYKEQGL